MFTKKMFSPWVFGAFLALVVGVSSAGESVDDFDVTVADITCSHLGKEYQFGEFIETPDSPCYHCTCGPLWTEPGYESCAIIDCPWQYYQTKPHCSKEYTPGKCCPELKCSAAPPEQDINYVNNKRDRLSTHGYDVTVEKESEIMIYCIGDDSTADVSEGDVTWTLNTYWSEKSVKNDTHTKMGFFPPATWAIFIDNVTQNDDGIYTCRIPTNPPQIQKTKLVVRIDPRPPFIDDICFKSPFNAVNNSECPEATDELPWYYSTTTTCTQHTKLSCSWSNENLFSSLSSCWDHCSDGCYSFPDLGPCDALMIRYHYDAVDDKCSKFTYGGCGGNRNNFFSREDCEDKCANIKFKSSSE